MRLTAWLWMTIVTLTVSGIANGEGWLDRVVAFKKKQFLADFVKTVPLFSPEQVEVQVKLAPAPPGYVDADWDEESALRLVGMLRRSGSPPELRRLARDLTRPFRRMLDPMLAPIPMRESVVTFKSKSWHQDNYFYYDGIDEAIEAEEADITYEEGDPVFGPEKGKKDKTPDEEAIVIVSNPVESQLPHSMISVKKLKDILWARALANRDMPPKPKKIKDVTITSDLRINKIPDSKEFEVVYECKKECECTVEEVSSAGKVLVKDTDYTVDSPNSKITLKKLEGTGVYKAKFNIKCGETDKKMDVIILSVIIKSEGGGGPPDKVKILNPKVIKPPAESEKLNEEIDFECTGEKCELKSISVEVTPGRRADANVTELEKDKDYSVEGKKIKIHIEKFIAAQHKGIYKALFVVDEKNVTVTILTVSGATGKVKIINLEVIKPPAESAALEKEIEFNCTEGKCELKSISVELESGRRGGATLLVKDTDYSVDGTKIKIHIEKFTAAQHTGIYKATFDVDGKDEIVTILTVSDKGGDTIVVTALTEEPPAAAGPLNKEITYTCPADKKCELVSITVNNTPLPATDYDVTTPGIIKIAIATYDAAKHEGQYMATFKIGTDEQSPILILTVGGGGGGDNVAVTALTMTAPAAGEPLTSDITYTCPADKTCELVSIKAKDTALLETDYDGNAAGTIKINIAAYDAAKHEGAYMATFKIDGEEKAPILILTVSGGDDDKIVLTAVTVNDAKSPLTQDITYTCPTGKACALVSINVKDKGDLTADDFVGDTPGQIKINIKEYDATKHEGEYLATFTIDGANVDPILIMTVSGPPAP